MNFAHRSVNKKCDALHQHWHKTVFFNHYKNVRIFSQKVIKSKYQGKLIQNQWIWKYCCLLINFSYQADESGKSRQFGFEKCVRFCGNQNNAILLLIIRTYPFKNFSMCIELSLHLLIRYLGIFFFIFTPFSRDESAGPGRMPRWRASQEKAQ